MPFWCIFVVTSVPLHFRCSPRLETRFLNTSFVLSAPSSILIHTRLPTSASLSHPPLPAKTAETIGGGPALTHIPPGPPSREPSAKRHPSDFVRPTAETVGYVESCTSTRPRYVNSTCSLSTFLVFVFVSVFVLVWDGGPPRVTLILVTRRYSRPHPIRTDLDGDGNESGRNTNYREWTSTRERQLPRYSFQQRSRISSSSTPTTTLTRTTETVGLCLYLLKRRKQRKSRGRFLRFSEFARRRSGSKTAEIEESTKRSVKTNTGRLVTLAHSIPLFLDATP